MESDGWLIVKDGLPCTVSLRLDSDRQFIRLHTWYKLPHIDEAEIAAAACRLNAEYFLVKFIAAQDHIRMTYDLSYGQGLPPATLIQLMRRFAGISNEAFATLPKPLVDMRSLEKLQQQRLH